MTPPLPPLPAVDVHTHVFPERLARAVRGALNRMYGWMFPIPDDPDVFAALLREHGTERFCILPYAHKPGMARALNEWTAQTAQRLEGAIPFACVHADDHDPRALLREAFALGCRGVKLHHQVQNVAPDDPRWDPVYELMQELDLPLVVHAGRGPTDNGLVGFERFRATMERHPRLRICVAHMGAPEEREFIALLHDYELLYLDTCGVRSFAQLPVASVRDRILYGSDAPNIPTSLDATIRLVLDAPLDDDAKRAIFRDNALTFLKEDECILER